MVASAKISLINSVLVYNAVAFALPPVFLEMCVDGVFRAADFLGKAHRLWDADKGRDIPGRRQRGRYLVGIYHRGIF